MNRTFCILAIMLACTLIFAGCQCEHKWDPATCSDPKTCQNCGVTEGDALGHSWNPATCNTPKTCQTCKQTEGKALQHAWTEATCTAPKTCIACALAEGEALAHTWVDADCEAPKTCSVCAATEGDPLGHIWQAASCDEPQTCTVCAAVNGETPGHIWVDATCDSPKTCSACNLTEGKAPGHQWAAATTEVPKTCTACGKTEGSAIKTDSRFTAAACQDIFGTWKSTITYTAQEWGITGYDCEIVEYVTCTFNNNGTMIITTGIDNFEEHKELIAYATEQEMYASYAEKGMTKEEADATCRAKFGMTVPEFAAFCASEYDVSDSKEMVYYVDDGQIYAAESWSDEMKPVFYKLKDNKLTLFDEDHFLNQEFTRV